MKVNSDISFKGFYNNKALKKGLEFAADNGALFAATTTLGFSFAVRPTAIMLTPNTDKKNKKIACTKSVTSSIIGYFLTLPISMHLADSIKKIDEKPEKYLKPETIKNLKNGCEKLYQSKGYSLSTQIFKLGLGLLIAAPKAALTCAGMPYVMQAIFPSEKQKTLSFKGKGSDKLANGIGKIIDKKGMQEFSKKYKDSNFPLHIIAITDTIATGTFIHQTKKSKKIEEDRKKALIYNAGISTGLSIISTYILDKLLDKPTQKFIEKFKKSNKGLPNLDKQVEGIRIAKPILLMGAVYYILIPLLSTFLADRAAERDKH